MFAASPSRPRRRLRPALLLPLAVAALVALLVVALRDRTPPGLVVDVRAEDLRGRPVEGAQVQRRYAPGWESLGPGGRGRLAGVLLRAAEAPSPAAIATALEVRAPHHALPPGGTAQVTPGADDGSWEARFVLEAFGRLRLHVAPTSLPAVRAWVVAPAGPGRIQAEGGVAVARVGQGAAWRVFGDLQRLTVWIEGATGVAARALEVRAPRAGFVREMTLTAEASRPIRGRIALRPSEPDVPTLRGRLDVSELGAPDDAETEHAPVLVADDGTFEVPYAGEGRYRLRPHLDFARVPARVARGGEEVTIDDARAGAWIVLDDVAGDESRVPRLRLERIDADSDPPRGSPRAARHARPGAPWQIPVPRPGTYRLSVELDGTDEAAPRAGAAKVVVGESGAHPVPVTLAEEPHGEVVVRVATPAGGGGADVELGARRRTVLFAMGPAVRFANVRAGSVVARVAWRDPEVATCFLAGRLEAGGTLELSAPAERGGHVAVRRPRSGAAVPRRLVWSERRSPYGDAAGYAVLRREAGTETWRTGRPLAPGRYEATLEAAGGGATETARRVTFEIRPGEVAAVELRGE